MKKLLFLITVAVLAGCGDPNHVEKVLVFPVVSSPDHFTNYSSMECDFEHSNHSR